jgi:hypothetical protein
MVKNTTKPLFLPLYMLILPTSSPATTFFSNYKRDYFIFRNGCFAIVCKNYLVR